MQKMAPLVGWQLFVDSFYTSLTLFKDLFKLKIPAIGMITQNPGGFPDP